MADLDLRPLSLGEILDRTFSLYRRNFLLFAGITAIPQLLILALRLAGMLLATERSRAGAPLEQLQSRTADGLLAFGIIGVVVALIVYWVVYVFAQGGTVYAVSELYLGRSTTIGAALGRVRGQLLILLAVTGFNFLAVMGAFIFLIIPGIYVGCRLLTCVPAALLEDLGPIASLERSFKLTKDYAGRSFVIYLLYTALVYAAAFLFTFPFGVAMGLSAKNPEAVRLFLALSHVGEFVAGVLVGPVLTIATAVFYYDLRVRKEAFDLQFMMNPTGPMAPGAPGVAKTFS
jgi:hypothetical protein